MNHKNEVFMDCHIILDCNCITWRSCFFTFAINFLSLDRLACIESVLHCEISLFQAFSCSLFVKNLFVEDVANETPKARSRMKKVELGMVASQLIAMGSLSLLRSVGVRGTFLKFVLAQAVDNTGIVCLRIGERPFLFRILRRSRLRRR